MAKQQEGTVDKIIKTTQKRMREAGFHGVSFRDIAADVGIKSASVHHHFPTKEDLGVAVTDAYTEQFLEALGDPDDPTRKPDELLKLYVANFRRALVKDKRMCLCGVLASEKSSLPNGVAKSDQAFFEKNIAWLEAVLRRKSPRMSPKNRYAEAVRIIATLEGAMLVASGLGDTATFDLTTATLFK
ncbi:MAG: TetR/AcrR family transcriptional regulator [Filomicrobium sp.]